MRGYDREELQDYDDYQDEGQEMEDEYEGEGEGEYEEYEKEPEPRKPTKEEMEYLELRKRLKESIRKQMKKESSTSRSDSSDRKNKLPYDNYGSFFGPSQPVIAQRVIQESKSLLENQHLASRLANPHQINKNKSKVSNGGSRSSLHIKPPRLSESQIKAQKLKNTRDYSFLLSDDADLPAPAKEPPPQNMSVRNSDARPAQLPGKNKAPLSNGGKHVHGNGENRKLVSAVGRLPPKSAPSNKLTSASKPSMTQADSRRHLGNHSGNGVNGPSRPAGPKGLPSKMPVNTIGNKSMAPGVKNPVNGVQKPLPSKVPSSVPRQSVEQRKDIREPDRPKMMPKPPVKQPVPSTKPQINKPLKQNSVRPAMQDHRPKRKPVTRYSDDEDDDEGGKAISMIRQMFRYNPNRFVDDDDDADMEAGFDEIMREERRSSMIAKKEDEEQLRLIEEEEERERRRKLSKLKKRKLEA